MPVLPDQAHSGAGGETSQSQRRQGHSMFDDAGTAFDDPRIPFDAPGPGFGRALFDDPTVLFDDPWIFFDAPGWDQDEDASSAATKESASQFVTVGASSSASGPE